VYLAFGALGLSRARKSRRADSEVDARGQQ
jgi:hypothetical protein